MKLVPIKVKIKNGANYKYPSFNQLNVVKNWMRAGNKGDWSNYIDTEGIGWKYDNAGSFTRVDGETPEGFWCAVCFVPVQFAQEALVAFPQEVTILDELTLEAFYDNRVAIEFPDEEIDIDIVEKIKLKKDLGLTLTPQQVRAIDPLDDEVGIRKNKNKTWKELKKKLNIVIVGI